MIKNKQIEEHQSERFLIGQIVKCRMNLTIGLEEHRYGVINKYNDSFNEYSII